MQVYVARHGETTWNVAGRYQGRRESALTALGEQQGRALAEAFAHVRPPIERIVASPLLRCSATAQFVADRLDLTLERDDRLIEIAHGTWEGRLRDDIASSEPLAFRAWQERPAEVAFDGGETLADVAARWRAFAASFDPRVPALVVTHDAVVRVAILVAQGRPLGELWNVAVENAGYAEFTVDGGRWTLVRENVTAHLTGVRASVAGQAL